jgi:hypothetical protein
MQYPSIFRASKKIGRPIKGFAIPFADWLGRKCKVFRQSLSLDRAVLVLPVARKYLFFRPKELLSTTPGAPVKKIDILDRLLGSVAGASANARRTQHPRGAM